MVLIWNARLQYELMTGVWGVGCGVCVHVCMCIDRDGDEKESQMPGEKRWGINFNLDSHSFHYPLKFRAKNHKTCKVVYERARSWYRLVTLAKLHKWPSGEPSPANPRQAVPGRVRQQLIPRAAFGPMDNHSPSGRSWRTVFKPLGFAVFYIHFHIVWHPCL